MSKKKKTPKRRNPFVMAMLRRHPRKQVMRCRRARRTKDARNSWRKEWDAP
jgi:hypothetical protein